MNQQTKMPRVSVKIHSQVRRAVVRKVQQVLDRVLPQIAALAVDEISREADRALHRTASVYKAGLQQAGSVTVTADGVVIRLLGDVAKALETGFDAYDLKAVMLMSNAVKFSDKGEPYVDVPFRHGMGDTTRFQGMPERIRADVQAQLRIVRARDGGLPNKMRVTGKMPGQTVTKNLRMQGAKVPIQTTHKTSIYSDMVRNQMGPNSSKYTTIRRISANSDSLSWWHPGFAGIFAFAAAKPRITHMAKQLVRGAFRNAGLASPRVSVV